MGNTKRVILIILTICILGPLVFVGACFPIGLVSFSSCFESNCSGFQQALFPLAFVIGLALAIFVIVKVIKKINKVENEPNSSTDIQ